MSDVVEALQADQVPFAAQHVFDWFWELQAGSINGMSDTLTFSDIESWSRLRNVHVRSWEALALVQMGLAFSAEQSKERKSSDVVSNSPKR